MWYDNVKVNSNRYTENSGMTNEIRSRGSREETNSVSTEAEMMGALGFPSFARSK